MDIGYNSQAIRERAVTALENEFLSVIPYSADC
jgi:hypothetical protein